MKSHSVAEGREKVPVFYKLGTVCESTTIFFISSKAPLKSNRVTISDYCLKSSLTLPLLFLLTLSVLT